LISLVKITISALLVSALFFPTNSFSQKEVVKLIFAETVKDVEGKVNVTQATGNVHFEHAKTHLYCDSALFFRDEDIIYAYQHVQINQGDTINLFCDSLKYYGKTKISKLQGNVRMRDKEYKLTTDSLEYNGNNSTGYYKNNAVITSINQELRLTSVKGYYHANDKSFFFKDSVRVQGDGYRIVCDTLEFQTSSSTAHFHGPTDILMDSTTVKCIAGIYYTKKNLVQLWDGAYLLDKNKTLYADSLIYNEKTGIGEGFCNVDMYDSTETIRFKADYMWKSANNDTLILKDAARIIDYSDKDTLVVLADSIFHYSDTLNKNEISIAETNVGILSGDLTVRCDSAYFSDLDSIVKFYYNPVMWSGETQMSSDSIFATYYDNEFHQLFMYHHAFIATEHDSLHYDQIKGKMMTAWLDSSKIRKVYVESNAETLYYVTKKEEDSLGLETETIDGMNKLDCNEIYIYFKNSEINTISFIDQPTANYYPFDQLPLKELFLKGFLWQIGLKPRSEFPE
jgi:lipopolysaccharide assembly outer membrane protein LptD (OstA)